MEECIRSISSHTSNRFPCKLASLVLSNRLNNPPCRPTLIVLALGNRQTSQPSSPQTDNSNNIFLVLVIEQEFSPSSLQQGFPLPFQIYFSKKKQNRRSPTTPSNLSYIPSFLMLPSSLLHCLPSILSRPKPINPISSIQDNLIFNMFIRSCFSHNQFKQSCLLNQFSHADFNYLLILNNDHYLVDL